MRLHRQHTDQRMCQFKNGDGVGPKVLVEHLRAGGCQRFLCRDVWPEHFGREVRCALLATSTRLRPSSRKLIVRDGPPPLCAVILGELLRSVVRFDAVFDLSIFFGDLVDGRHTAASLAISAGANVKVVVQRMLGHAKASMTLDTYADLFDTDLDAVAVNLDVAIRTAADARRASRR